MLLDVMLKFNNRIKSQYVTEPDKIRFLLEHERKEKVLNQLCHQIQIAQTRLGPKFARAKYDKLIHSVADGFSELAIKHRNEQNMSDNEKGRIVSEHNHWKEVEAVVDGKIDHKEWTNS